VAALAETLGDVLGRRIAKRVYSASTGGTVAYTRFVYHGGAVAYETDSAGTTVTLKYTWGPGADNLLAIDDGTNHYYVVQDRLHSVRGLVKRDGTWIRSLRYLSYGGLEADTASGSAPSWELRYRWTGRELDTETGLYFFRARYYDPGARRFVQEDPIGFGGGGNLFEYGNGGPLEGRDPGGTIKDCEAISCMQGAWASNCWSLHCNFGDPPPAGEGRFSDGGSGDWDENGLDDEFEFEEYSWGYHRWLSSGRRTTTASDSALVVSWHSIWYHGILGQTSETNRDALLHVSRFGGLIPRQGYLDQYAATDIDSPHNIHLSLEYVTGIDIAFTLAHELWHWKGLMSGSLTRACASDPVCRVREEIAADCAGEHGSALSYPVPQDFCGVSVTDYISWHIRNGVRY
jgi:RHS repeat-associated protein